MPSNKTVPTLCPLCQPARGVIARGRYWTLMLNDNQALLGRCYAALNRHATDLLAVTPAEQDELFRWLRAGRAALDARFQPDHYNYVALMNATPHVHMHVVPRYAAERPFAGESFADTAYGGHYDPTAERFLAPDGHAALIAVLAAALPPDAPAEGGAR